MCVNGSGGRTTGGVGAGRRNRHRRSGERIAELAPEHPDKPALIFLPRDGGSRSDVTWRELDRAANQVARLLAERGVCERSMVVVGLWNSPEAHPRRRRRLEARRARAAAAGGPAESRARPDSRTRPACARVASEWDDVAFPLLHPDDLAQSDAYSDDPLPDDAPHPGKAIASGGSTGRSKIITDATFHPVRYAERSRGTWRASRDRCSCWPRRSTTTRRSWRRSAGWPTTIRSSSWRSSMPNGQSTPSSATGSTTPTCRRSSCDASCCCRISTTAICRACEAIQSSAAPCPEWLKRAWIDLIGAEKVHEVYGSTEGIGATMIRGDEWLEHPGSVGRPVSCELRILDEDGQRPASR